MVGEYGILLIKLRQQYSKKVIGIVFSKYHYNFSYINSTDNSQISISGLNLLLEFYFVYHITYLLSPVTSLIGLSKLTCPKTNSSLTSPSWLDTTVFSNSVNSDSILPIAQAKNLRSHPWLLVYASDPIHQQFLLTRGLKHIQILTSSHPFLVQATILFHSDYCSNFQYGFPAYSFASLPYFLFHIAARVNL